MLRYPIGPFEPELDVSPASRRELIAQLAAAPANLRAAVTGLNTAQLDTPWRPGGWTIRQLVHHLADSQLNWYIRTKLALTEDEPVVKPYDEAAWAETDDARSAPIEPSLLLFEALNRRWVILFLSLTDTQWRRKLIHPERGVFVLDTTLPMHVWHGLHHTAQIRSQKS